MTQNLTIRPYLMQDLMELDVKKFSDPEALTSGVSGLKIVLGQFGHKAFGKGIIKTLVKNPAPIFTNRTSFSQES